MVLEGHEILFLMSIGNKHVFFSALNTKEMTPSFGLSIAKDHLYRERDRSLADILTLFSHNVIVLLYTLLMMERGALLAKKQR